MVSVVLLIKKTIFLEEYTHQDRPISRSAFYRSVQIVALFSHNKVVSESKDTITVTVIDSFSNCLL